ncbi:MAG TPA: GNAT family N-acetyltransferase [Myxococcaceae bacterium]|nr:GNAT family N-acetyltransferase [Myxococcaceae bacterium]
MTTGATRDVSIRRAHPEELPALGQLVADAYAALPGMPGPAEQPGYYAMVRDAPARARNPAIHVLAAVGGSGELLGSADFISDMAHYGSGGTAGTRRNTSGIRLLAVAPGARGQGIGRALTLDCVERARALGRAAVVLHTTRAMQTAWHMYEQLGFRRTPDLDFRQGELDVFGFALDLRPERRPLSGSRGGAPG